MDELLFWKGWNKPHQRIYLFLLGLFFLSLIFLLYGIITGFEAVAEWKVQTNLETIFVPIETFIHNLITFSVDTENFLVKQRYRASEIIVTPWHGYVWLSIICLSFSAFLAVVSRLETFWMGLGMATFLFFIGTSGIETLEVFGLKDKTFVIILLSSFLILVSWIYYFAKNLTMIQRFLIFAAFMGIAALVIAAGSHEPTPFLYISRFGIVIPLAISAIFMFIVAYDLIYMFLFLVTASKSISAKNNLLQFIIISILYLGNLFLIIVKKLGVVDWDIFYFDPFLIFLLSTIAGVWVFKPKIAANTRVLPFRPYGAIFYLSLAVITLSTISYAFVTGNDPLTEMLENLILYSHISFGLTYFFYVIINFSDLFKKNVQIYQVAFKPRRLPLFMVTAVALVGVLALVAYRKFIALNRAKAGYYILAGDAFYYNEKFLLAKEYYKSSTEHAYQNHRGNYSLASASEKLGQTESAQRYYTNATGRNPTPYAFVNLSNIYLDADMFFPALLQLRDGEAEFPKNAKIQNNLGLIYGQTSMLDSSYYFFQEAIANADDPLIPITSMLAVLTDKGLKEESDSLADNYSFPKSEGFQANKAAIKNSLSKAYQEKFSAAFLADSAISEEEFAYLINVAVNKVKEENPEIREALQIVKTEAITEKAQLIQTLNEWYTGSKHKASLEFRSLILQNTATASRISKIFGSLLLKHKSYDPALKMLKQSITPFSPAEDRLPLAVALLENNQFDEAREELNIIENTGEGQIKKTAHEILTAVTTNPDSAIKAPENRRYLFLHFRKNELSEKQLSALLDSFEDPGLKTLATADLMEFYLQKDKLLKAREIYDSLNIKDRIGEYFSGELNLQYLYMLLREKKWTTLQETIKEVHLNDYATSHQLYFKARLSDEQGDSLKAKKLYLQALNENPYNEEVVAQAVKFFNQRKNYEKAFTIISEAVELQNENPKLLKIYARQALRVNLVNFAEETAEDLEYYLNQKEYQEFIRSYKTLKDSLEQTTTF